jgi:hypothetical protein
MYAPGTGRFVSRDPLGYNAGVALYAYSQNSPSRRVDPYGQASVELSVDFEYDNGYLPFFVGTSVESVGTALRRLRWECDSEGNVTDFRTEDDSDPKKGIQRSFLNVSWNVLGVYRVPTKGPTTRQSGEKEATCPGDTKGKWVQLEFIVDDDPPSTSIGVSSGGAGVAVTPAEPGQGINQHGWFKVCCCCDGDPQKSKVTHDPLVRNRNPDDTRFWVKELHLDVSGCID